MPAVFGLKTGRRFGQRRRRTPRAFGADLSPREGGGERRRRQAPGRGATIAGTGRRSISTSSSLTSTQRRGSRGGGRRGAGGARQVGEMGQARPDGRPLWPRLLPDRVRRPRLRRGGRTLDRASAQSARHAPGRGATLPAPHSAASASLSASGTAGTSSRVFASTRAASRSSFACSSAIAISDLTFTS